MSSRTIIDRQLKQARQYLGSGRLQDAANIYRRLLSTQPNNCIVHYSFGNFLWAANQPELAAKHYKIAIRLRPGYSEAIGNLGTALWAAGQKNEAIQCYKQVIELTPENPQAYYNLGGSYYITGQGEKAVQALSRATQLDPTHSNAQMTLGNAYYEQGFTKEAKTCYKQTAALTRSGGSQVRLVSAIPMMPVNAREIPEIRSNLSVGLDRLIQQHVKIEDPIKENGYTNFFLAYHGEDDLLLQKKYAELYVKACPALGYTAKHCVNYSKPKRGRKIRIGFISKNLCNHSIGNTSKGIIALLSRKIFHVTTIFSEPPHDETSKFIADTSDAFTVIPQDLAAARKIISGLELDILYYQDTGLDPFNFFLAFSRLAPVQCTSFGHPVTTGIPNLDYYISTELWEPEDADSQYSEKLARLKGVASVAYYYKPNAPKALLMREHFNVPDDANVYICPQTLFKFHPDFDVALNGILQADPKALIILIEGKHRHWAEILKSRFKDTITEDNNRIQFLPRQSAEDFINLIAVSDVMLDTFHFCGFNTTLQGFAVGTPVVTLPGRFMRGRHTLSFYKKMAFEDLVATDTEDYIRIATAIGKDPGYRKQLSDLIKARSELIWQETAVIDEFERFFQGAVDRLI